MEDILDAIGALLEAEFDHCDYQGWKYSGAPSPGYIFTLVDASDGEGDSYHVRFTSHFLHEFNPNSIVQALEDYGVVQAMQENTNTIVRVNTQGLEIWDDND